MVTTAYRLNIFGFFTTNDNVAPGNFGLLDQVAALDWVIAKISIFGGSPSNVVLCGHSAGGTGVGLHLLSPLSQGKFVRAIAMSSRGLISRSVKMQSKMDMHKHDIAEIFGCAMKSSLLVECLRKQDADYFLEHVGYLLDAFGPVIDVDYANNSRAFLTNDPVELIKGEQFAKVPLLVGYTSMEDALEFLEEFENLERGMSWDDFNLKLSESVINDISDHNVNDSCLEELATEHLADTVRFFYTPKPLTNDLTVLRDRYVDFSTEKNYGAGAYLLAGALSQTNTPTFMYRFDYRIKTDNFIRFPKNNSQIANWVNAPHQFDLAFVWGMPYWTHLLRNITWNSADKKMADTLLTLWGNFVKFGNPTHSGVNLKWDMFKENISGIMILDRNSNMSDTSSFDYKAFEFWNDYYPKVWNILLRGCNMTNAGVPTADPRPQCYQLLLSLYAVFSAFCISSVFVR